MAPENPGNQQQRLRLKLKREPESQRQAWWIKGIVGVGTGGRLFVKESNQTAEKTKI